MATSIALAAVAAGGAALMDALGMGKAYLKIFVPQIVTEPSQPAAIKPKSTTPYEELKFDYNPKELTFNGKANTSKTPVPGQPPDNQLLGPEPEKHTFELFYSRFELPDLGGGGMFNDIQKLKDLLFTLVVAHPEANGGPGQANANAVAMRPLVQFGWGPFVSKYSFVESVDVTFEAFMPNGTPMRMKAKVSIEEARPPEQGQNPTSGGKTARRTHTLLAGETLAAVAFKEYSNPTMWRAIAEENGIDDPFRLVSGTTLLLPPVDEAVELA